MLLCKEKTVLTRCLVVGILLLGSAFGHHALTTDKRALATDQSAPAPQKNRLADTLILLDKQWWEATSKNDVDTMSKILADDWVGTNPACSDWNKKNSLDFYRHARYAEVKILTERRVIRIDEHTAIMTYQVNGRLEE